LASPFSVYSCLPMTLPDREESVFPTFGCSPATFYYRVLVECLAFSFFRRRTQSPRPIISPLLTFFCMRSPRPPFSLLGCEPPAPPVVCGFRIFPSSLLFELVIVSYRTPGVRLFSGLSPQKLFLPFPECEILEHLWCTLMPTLSVSPLVLCSLNP